MRISEIYRSVQGEGFLTGVESVFVRTSGCNLRCWYCDTPHTSWTPRGHDVSVDEIVAQVEEWDCRHVVLTGGEPMLYAELAPLCQRLKRMGRHVTIETAGTLDLPVECDLMSISPKLAGSGPPAELHSRWARRHERDRHAPDVIRSLVSRYEYQVKFVIDTPADCDEFKRYLREFPEIDRERVLLMPQGVDPLTLAETSRWLKAYCVEHNVQFCPRRQIEWFGFARGT